MQLAKIDLSNLVAISHDDKNLGLVIDRGDSLEFVEIPAPIAAYAGLQQLNTVVAESPFDNLPNFNQLPGVPPVQRLSVESQMAEAIGYDSDRCLLQIEFHNGSVYEYEGVDADTWNDLKTSDSVGRFFNHEIRSNYRSRCLG